jgi:hypothetical protein
MRYKLTEPTYILGKFSAGATVTLALYDLADESAVALTSNACNEVAALGVYAWSTANITTQPVARKEYLWVMTDGTETQYGKIVLGGYPDELDAAVSSRLAAGSYVAPDNAGIAALPTLAEIEESAVLAKAADVTAAESAIRGGSETLESVKTAVENITVDNEAIADAVWDEEKIGHTGDLKIIADNLDTPVSSRLAAEDYVPPDNTAISGLPTLSEIEASTILAKEETLNTVRKLTSNRVKLENNQLLIYDDNCIDIIKTYNLFDEDGDPNLTEVYDRVPV